MSQQEEQQAKQQSEEIKEASQAQEKQSQATETSEDDNQQEKVAQLSAKLDSLALELKNAKENELRAYAEMENLRKRTEADLEKAHKFALSGFTKDLLPVIDALEKALECIDKNDEAFANINQGVEITLKSLMSVVTKYGLEQLNPKGEQFDPNTQHAISMIDAGPEVKPNTVLDVVQKGYNLNGRNIRPAMVVVTKPQPTDVEA